jgi:hypothetical protein
MTPRPTAKVADGQLVRPPRGPEPEVVRAWPQVGRACHLDAPRHTLYE